MSFWVAAGLLNGRVNTITNSIPLLISGNESIITLHRLGDTGETRPYYGTKRIPFTGRIDLEGIRFGYDKTPILSGVDLKIREKSNIAILGANGAGKSTILLLLLGFYRPHAGQLLADGIPYDNLDMVELRRHIGVVMQHPTFFSGTIGENISYGCSDATLEKIRRAAHIALADEFIEKLPDGYDTPVGEEGVLLSGGEVQRIAIARALLRRLKLLILDEPTNHLELSAINRLMKNLLELDERPALVTISHDPDVFAHATELYHLENGILRRGGPVPAGPGGAGGPTGG
ncbi:MAG: ABC transporter ATP-binding protein/permease [Candidatus Eisenbacteria bacterium]|nr:ABC transporter ATP-binding protein/permease [Candidatus Eisenbacteria bacterium]